jgi:ribosomal protein S9
MAKRKNAEETTMVMEKELLTMEDRRRDLLVAVVPDGVTEGQAEWLWEAMGVLREYAPEELQRLQVATLLLILERQERILAALQERGNAGAVGEAGGFDASYFRALIAQELGEEPNEETLSALAALAGDPGRLERAIASTRRYLEQNQVDKPIGFLMAKLRSWREQDIRRSRR